MKEGWRKESLKDACKVFADGDWIETKNQSPEGIRLVQTGNIGFGFYKDKKDKARFISAKTFEELKCTEILPGDLLVSRLPDPVGKSCIIPDLKTKMITGVDCTIIRPEDYLIPEFLGYYQMSNEYLRDVQSRVTGTTRSRISRKNLGLIQIPIPPLAEQKQIIALLDQAFAAIDQAKAKVEQNIANAKELFQSKLNEIFSQRGDGWVEKSLGAVCELKNGYAFKSKEFTKDGIRLLRNCNVFHGSVDWSNTAYYPESALDEFKRFELLEGDIVLSLDRPIISSGLKLARIRDVDVPSLLLQRVLCIRSNSINGDYIFAWMGSPNFIKEIDPGKSVGVPHISLKEVSKIKLPVPSNENQLQVALVVNSLKKQVDRILDRYQEKINNLEELKKSLLQKAFAGELTSTGAVRTSAASS